MRTSPILEPAHYHGIFIFLTTIVGVTINKMQQKIAKVWGLDFENFRVIFAFCSTDVLQNAKNARKITKGWESAICMYEGVSLVCCTNVNTNLLQAQSANYAG